MMGRSTYDIRFYGGDVLVDHERNEYVYVGETNSFPEGTITANWVMDEVTCDELRIRIEKQHFGFGSSL